MKYTVEIEGGFTGIPGKFHGNVVLGREEVITLIQLLQQSPAPGNPLGRDTLTYRVKFEEGSLNAQSEFTDKDLPETLRLFIDKIKSRGSSN